ncbi:MAG: AAA family ATPase [Chlorobi bacterium]|nr:AAA family ATPase [Chlorobiota bacterium]MBX7218245.1 AAA family ATPase [Candidatus Kapabacteria bacterium]
MSIPSAAIPSIDRFVRSGALPFVGRVAELEQISQLWSHAEPATLRAMLVVGEAGSGKSRLVEEAIRRIAAADGAVVHARLRPEESASIGPVLALAMWGSESAGGLLKQEPEGTIPAAAAALQRIAGLRRTLLVIEDIHLLQGATLREFAMLLDSLADDSLALLCTSRPADLEARQPLQPFLQKEVALAGLEGEALSELWDQLFGGNADPQALRSMERATLGNPLAFRSALRGAINTGAMRMDERTNAWRVSLAPAAFAEVVERTAQRISEGMIAHLSDEELHAAQLLAVLGESFSFEAATLLLPNVGPMVEQLMEQGVIVRPHTASHTLNGVASAQPPFAFVHTLLHRSLWERAAPPFRSIVALLTDSPPLFSVRPFQLLAERALPQPLPQSLAERAIAALLPAASALDHSADWPYALTIYHACEAIYQAVDGWENRTDQHRVRIELLMRGVNQLRTRNAPEAYAGMIDEIMEISATLLDDGYPTARMYAFPFQQEYLWRCQGPAYLNVWDQVQELCRSHPEVRYDFPYLEFLGQAMHFAIIEPDLERMGIIEQEIDELMASEQATEPFKNHALLHVARYLILKFDTLEELARRQRLRQQLDALDDGDLRNRPWVLEFLFTTGAPSETIAQSDRLVRYFRDAAYWQSFYSAMLLKLASLALMGAAATELQSLLAALPNWGNLDQELHGLVARRCWDICLALALRFDIEGAMEMAAFFQLELGDAPLSQRLFWQRCAASGGEVPDEFMEEGGEEHPLLRLWKASTLPVEPATMEMEVEMKMEMARELLHRPILRIYDLADRYTFLAIAQQAEQEGNPWAATKAAEALRQMGIRSLVEWFVEHGIHTPIEPLLDRYGSHLPKEEATRWLRAGRAMAKNAEGNQPTATPPEPALRVGMFGKITTQPRGAAEPSRLRGARNQALLGLLVADAMLREPLERIDFCRLATNDSEDPDRARRSMNVAVLRLREAIGTEMILTDGDTPRLNRELCHVDILDAYAALRQARQALREGGVADALRSIQQMLALWRGQVPFPGLYDEFYESLREEFESRARSTAVAVAKRLLNEDDPAGAEQLLQQTFSILPEDEEVGNLLQSALLRQGKLADTQWVAMKAEENE